MNKDLKTGYIALLLVSFFWGTTYIAAKIGTRHMPGLYIAGVRQFLSGFIMVSFFLLRGVALPGLADLKKISIQSIFLLCIANGLLTWSLEFINSGLAAIIAALVPLFIALFSIWLSQCARITFWMAGGLAIGFAGIVTIFYDYLGNFGNPSFSIGILLAMLSVLSWSFGTVYTAKHKLSIGILYSVGWQMLIAGTILLLVCLVTGKYISLADSGLASWYALSYLVVFGSLLAYSAYVVAINKLPPTLVSVYAYINPMVAVAFGWLLLQEKMNAHMVLGTLITITGVYVVNRENKKQQA